MSVISRVAEMFVSRRGEFSRVLVDVSGSTSATDDELAAAAAAAAALLFLRVFIMVRLVLEEGHLEEDWESKETRLQ